MSAAKNDREQAARAVIDQARRHEVVVPTYARQRVWGRLERTRSGATRRFAWAMFCSGVTAALLFAVVLQFRHAPTLATVRVGGKRIAIVADQALPQFSQPTLVDITGTGKMVVGPDTLVTLARLDADGIVLRVQSGSALLHVLPRTARTPFWVKTPRFTAKVVGTVLRVVVKSDGTASIAVGHGAVQVEPTDAPALTIRSGERWPKDATDAPATDELVTLGAADLEGVTTAAFAPPPQAPVVINAPEPTCVGTSAETVSCYLALAEHATPVAAESALYEAGWIALRDLHEPQRALKMWEHERELFPAGVLRDEVSTSVIDALVATRQPERALAEISSYLHAEGRGSLRAAEMHLIRGSLLRNRDGDCRLAAKEFALAAADSASPFAARAERAQAACAQIAK